MLLLSMAAFTLIAGTFIFRQHKEELEAKMREMAASEDAYTFVAGHNVTVSTWFGGKFEYYPKKWAAALLGGSLLLVIASLVFLLHVPNQEGSGLE